MTLQAGAPSPVLLASLKRAGWGDLAGADLRGVRAVLEALVGILPARSAQGTLTAEQLATAAGYSEKWTRRCLHFLEDLDLVDWHRGGVHNGRPQPSYVRLDKRVLLELVQAARDVRDAALLEIRRRTNARIAGLRLLYVKSKRRPQNPRSRHAEPTTSLSPHGEETRATRPPVAPPPAGPPADPVQRRRYLEAARAALRANR